MKASEFSQNLCNQLRQLSIDGVKHIPTNDLASILEKHSQALKHAEKTGHAATVDLQVEYYKARATAKNLMFQSVIDYGKKALNSALLINGGAAVALLAFIGNIAKQTSLISDVQGLTGALTSFTSGVLCSAMATGSSYLAQQAWANDEKSKWGSRWNICALVLVIGSYVFFFSGLLISRRVFLGL